MEIIYLIDGKKFLDNYQIREYLKINKSELQHLFNKYEFPTNETLTIQNKKLYSLKGLCYYIENILKTNEG